MKIQIIDSMKPIYLAASGIGVVISDLTNKYLFSEPEYLKWLIIAVTLDLITGITKVWAKQGIKNVTSKGIRDTIFKFIQYGSFLIITHVLANITFGNSNVPPFAFVKEWAYMLLLLIEIKSVYENIVAIDSKLDFVKVIIDRLSKVISEKRPKDE